MPDFKADIMFSQGNAGWMETFYFTKNGRDVVFECLSRIIVPRSEMLAGEAVIFRTRVSDVAVLNDSETIDAVIGSNTFSAFAPDLPWQGALVRMQSATGRRRMMVLRGVPDAISGDDRTLKLTANDAAWSAQFDIWVAEVLECEARLKILDTGAAFPLKQINAVTVDPISKRLVLNVPNHGYQSYDKVLVQRAFAIPGINGRYEILRVDADNLQLVGSNRSVIAYAGNGVVRKVSYLFDPIQSIIDVGQARHKSGVGPDPLKGRNRSA